MKIRYVNVFLACVFTLGVVSCASTRMGKGKVSVDKVDELMPDSTYSVEVDVVINVPEEAFSRRNRLVIVPQLVKADTMLAECTPIVLDAPIYTKKMERRKQIAGYVDTLASSARSIENGKDYTIPYREKVKVPFGLQGGRIIAVLSSDGCGECGVVDTVDVAYIGVPMKWIDTDFEVIPKVLRGRGEALLQFVINKYDIKLSFGSNETEMNRMLGDLRKITEDSLARLDSVSIYGMASADGPYKFNTTLSYNRANSAKNWLVEQLGLEKHVTEKFSIGSRPEGWLPVLEAMTAGGHPDSVKVKDILEKYNAENDDVAERYIRRLSCWRDIRENYLQKDRKVEYTYTYTIRSFVTDEELLDMYEKRPDAFNEEEFLRVVKLKKTHAEKKEALVTTLKYFPQSKVAANNLAVLLIRENKADEAEKLMEMVKSNTLNTEGGNDND